MADSTSTPNPAAVVVAVQSVPLWKTRVFWLNIIAIAVALLSAPEIISAVGPVVGATTLTSVIAALNIIQRLWTFGPVANSPGESKALAAQPAALEASKDAPSPTLVQQ